MQIDVNNFFIAQVVPEISAKIQVPKSARCVFLLLTVFPEMNQNFLKFCIKLTCKLCAKFLDRK